MISSKPAVNIIPTTGGFLFAEDGQDVLFYQRETKHFNAAHSRSHYVHPLYGLDGELLTEEFPSDHPITVAFSGPGTRCGLVIRGSATPGA